MIRSLNERRRTKENLVNKDWQIGEEEEAGLENKIDVRCTTQFTLSQGLRWQRSQRTCGMWRNHAVHL